MTDAQRAALVEGLKDAHLAAARRYFDDSTPENFAAMRAARLEHDRNWNRAHGEPCPPCAGSGLVDVGILEATLLSPAERLTDDCALCLGAGRCSSAARADWISRNPDWEPPDEEVAP